MLLKKLTPWIIGCALLCAACFIGYQKGVAVTTQKNLAAEIASLNKSLDGLAEQTKKAGQVNLQLHNAASVIKKAQAKSTQEFTNALNSTAHLRFNCVFDNSIMQQLFQAADAADTAATSGITGALRTGGPPH